ncbi:MAG: hypothetical protein CSA65_02985 [Proteobacteria bacterium]|nr:MAG: hypothetical protein CSB49_05155 [Pseudomonadota bacterium]PIE19265.1 MAG: hypothetical protein CSA65_02985 [Pseudomonadota bacterium]
MPKKPATEPAEVVARAVLISHANAEKSTSGREKAVAIKRAKRVVAAARKQGADFGKLVMQVSDEPAKDRKKLKTFHRGPGIDPNKELLEAALALGVGQVSAPIETPRGFWVLMRVEPEEYSTAHILIQYKGAKLSKPAMKRSKDEAKTFAEKLAKTCKEGKEPFSVIAGRYSDSPSKVRGGVITPIGPDRLLPGFQPYLDAVKKLKDDAISDVVETPYGFHVIKRLPLKKIMVRHILIRHNDAKKPPQRPRAKTVAKQLAFKLMRKVKKAPADFAKIAKKESEDDSAKDGGLMAPFARGQMVPRFEQFAFALKVGQISDVVESVFGYHVIKRER